MNSSPEPSARTFGNENGLPRVPLPALEDSCARFLEWCSPLLDEAALAQTRAAVEEFQRPGGPGRTLHAALEEYDAAEGVHSWLDTFWPYRYLGRRDRIALNANFFFLFDDAPGAGPPQAARAAGLVAGALDYKLRLDDERVPPAMQRGRPLSMVQNRFLFSATRIPGEDLDTVRVPYSDEWPGPSRARHIVVFFRGAMFRMDVLGPDGRPHTLGELTAGLDAIMKSEARPDEPVGHLTTMARAEWARARRELLDLDPRNAASLEEVETALFCLCLEDFTPADDGDACDHLLHGDSGNRWFDKAVSLIVFADGTAGINVEHCGLDGTTILAFVDALLGESPEVQSARSGAVVQGEPTVEPIEFVLDEGLRRTVRDAGEAFAAYGAATATTTVPFDDFGGDRAKSLRVSPDAFVQMAYQLAHKRAKGFTGATYESIATRHFRHGRTEAMRVVTPEVLRFVEAMEDPMAGSGARRTALRAAADAHVRRAKECQAGQAPEQHLWELQLIQKRRGAELGAASEPPLFSTPGWQVMRDDYLSTSSAPSTSIRYFGFGSTSEHCIGIAYVLLPDRFNVYLSTPQKVAGAMHAFAGSLREAVAELQELLASDPAAHP